MARFRLSDRVAEAVAAHRAQPRDSGVLLCLRTLHILAMVCAVLGIATVAHAQSALDGFNPGANGAIQALAVQPDGKILVGGSFTGLGGGTGTTTRNYIGRLNSDGSLDTSFNPGANGFVFALAVQPDGKILVGGSFTTLGGGGTGTTARNRIGRLNADGTLDTGFNPGANSSIFSLAVLPDGKILVGGDFSGLGGGTGATGGATTRNYIGRLNADGSLDASFNPGANNVVYSLAVQPDGQILVGGNFTTLGGGGTGTTTRNRIGRLNADGSLDTSFNPGADDYVYRLAVQPDGKILVGGPFTTLGGGGSGTTTRNRIGRLNADGSLDAGFNPGANGTVTALAVQPDGKILVGGGFTMLGGGGTGTTTRNYLGRLNADGSLDPSFDPGANLNVSALAVQADGKILVGGFFTTLGGGGTGTTTRNRIGLLYPDGSVDADFNPGSSSSPYAITTQSDGKIVVGGAFGTLGGGGTGTTTRNRIGRLNPGGVLDPSFNPGANNTVYAVAVQPDGKILVGGNFTTLGGGGTGTLTRNRIGRLNADGTLDETFNPGANGRVSALAVQADGKILVGGFFTMLGGGGTGTTTRNRIGRLNADGSLDDSFNPGANFEVNSIALQGDGRILVGGGFSMLGGGTGTTTRRYIGRLNADGTLDASFDPGAGGGSVWTVAVQADGKVVIGGDFTTLGGGGSGTTPRNWIGRINADGSLDESFNPGANGAPFALAVQADGKILVGGEFSTLGGGGTGTTPRSRIGRLNADGSLDTSFNPGAENVVLGLSLQADGKILIGGAFLTLAGTTRNYVGRLTNTDSALQSLSVTGSGSIVTWSRSGAGPEVWRVTFESSTDGVTYTSLGNGTRVTGGWQLGGLSLPTLQNLFIRARGYYGTGFQNGSGSVVESIRNVYLTIAPTIATQPSNQTVTAGANATFTVAASGNPTPTVQWQVSTNSGSTWTDLTNTAPYSGVTTATLTITGASASLSGNQYRAVATNGAGTATSTGATLTVNTVPAITTQPANQTVAAGGTATFTAAASGNPAPTVQWQVSTNSGASFSDISGATSTTYALTTAAADNGKQVRAVFTNGIGTATSSAATLTVTVPTMSLDKTSLVFGAVNTGAAFTSQTSAQTVRLTQTGGGTVTWTAASTTPWLVVAPTAGSGSATLTVSTQFASGLTASQTGSVTLTFTGAGNTAGPITVTLNSLASGTASTGSFDTPIDGTTGVTGSIAVTGWALDDVEVTGVRILRDPIAGEPAGTLVFIGNAVLVDGARPDVQASFPNLPRNTRAGWGYLMLTNFLPGLGNGTFRLTAIADDADGHATVLGSKTITCTNSTATAPTGAIDTPAQGGIVSGNVTNFGWVLSPNPRRADPPGGGTVQIVIDGAFISAVPSGWTSRADLSALFPAAQYPGIVNALGVGSFDSTALANGVHTVSWVVTDNLGSASGIGSRYFTVSNGSLLLEPTPGSVTVGGAMAIDGSTSLAMPDTAVHRFDSAGTLAWDINAAPGDVAAIPGRRGFRLDTPLEAHAVRDGRATVQSEELDRIELHLSRTPGHRYTGYLRVRDSLAPLPIGSSLNASTGEFTWGPGVGFVGPYDLVFVQWSGDQAVARQEVRVVLGAKGSTRVGPQTVIDTPKSAPETAVVGRSFVLAGWAADLDATVDRGVDTVHVWAYPASGDDPIWIGAATYGGARPDVAAVYGDRFLATGYGLTVQGLAPGTYDLAVFAYSTVIGGFVPAKTVRVTIR